MKWLINWIFDTFHEFVYDRNENVYIAGKYYFDRLVLTTMIQHDKPVPKGWETLTQPMPKTQANERIKHFKLMKGK